MKEKVLEHNPLSESEKILSEDFYGTHSAVKAETAPAPKEKPTHYKIMCVSMYLKDIKELEEKVAALKARGYTRANKSQLIRMALRRINVDDIEIPTF